MGTWKGPLSGRLRWAIPPRAPGCPMHRDSGSGPVVGSLSRRLRPSRSRAVTYSNRPVAFSVCSSSPVGDDGVGGDEAPWSSSVPWNTGGASGRRSSGDRDRNGIPRTVEECREMFIGYQVYAMEDATDERGGNVRGERKARNGSKDGNARLKTVPVGIVDDVMCAGDDIAGDVGSGLEEYFLLKVVNPHLQDEDALEGKHEQRQEEWDDQGEDHGEDHGDAFERHIEEQHLIPLVPSIVPVIDASNERLVLSPPPGLLELGRRQAVLARIDRLLRKSGIVSSVYIESPDGFQEELKPRMPTRRELEEMGRHDVVKLVLENGGFLDVAQCLGYRGRRKPPGYWEDEEVLDRELSLFVGSGWIRMEALDSDEESSTDDGDDNRDGGDDYENDEHGNDNKKNDFATDKERNEVENETGKAETSTVSNGATTTYNSYWYNTVTRQLRWTQPTPPQIIPLDDMGINSIIVETEDDRAMPSRSSLLAAGRYDLHTAIVSQGGYSEVSSALNRWPAWPPTRKLRNIKTLKSEITKFIREHQLDKRFLPAASDFLDLGRPDIHQVIVARFGGYKEVGRRIGLRSHRGGGVDWRDFDAVCREVVRYCAENGLDHLPSHETLRKSGRHDLRYAFQKWKSVRISEATGVGLRNARGGWKGRKTKMTKMEEEHDTQV